MSQRTTFRTWPESKRPVGDGFEMVPLGTASEEPEPSSSMDQTNDNPTATVAEESEPSSSVSQTNDIQSEIRYCCHCQAPRYNLWGWPWPKCQACSKHFKWTRATNFIDGGSCRKHDPWSTPICRASHTYLLYITLAEKTVVDRLRAAISPPRTLFMPSCYELQGQPFSRPDSVPICTYRYNTVSDFTHPDHEFRPNPVDETGSNHVETSDRSQEDVDSGPGPVDPTSPDRAEAANSLQTDVVAQPEPVVTAMPKRTTTMFPSNHFAPTITEDVAMPADRYDWTHDQKQRYEDQRQKYEALRADDPFQQTLPAPDGAPERIPSRVDTPSRESRRTRSINYDADAESSQSENSRTTRSPSPSERRAPQPRANRHPKIRMQSPLPPTPAAPVSTPSERAGKAKADTRRHGIKVFNRCERCI